MQGMESFAVEGTYKSFKFTNNYSSTPLVNGQITRVRDTAGVVFVAQKFSTATGAAETLDVDYGEEGVLIYNCEKIRVDKAAVAIHVGDAVYWDGVTGSAVSRVWQSGWFWIGICVEEADADDAQVLIDLHGNHVVADVPAFANL